MMRFLFLIFIFLSSHTAFGCNTVNDPLPNGGATCITDVDCNSVNRGGVCAFNNVTGHFCVCAKEWGMSNCTYQRKDQGLAGGLQIGLEFVSVAGVGNLIIGRTGPGVAQLLMFTFIIYIGGIFLCIAGCCGGGICIVVIGILMGISGVASFIWGIVDGAHMLQGKFTDASGYCMY